MDKKPRGRLREGKKLKLTKLKVKMLKLLKLVPSFACRPICGRRGYNASDPYCKSGNVYLTMNTLMQYHCLQKTGRLFKKPCPFLKWFLLDPVNWPPLETSLLEFFNWEEPEEISLLECLSKKEVLRFE